MASAVATPLERQFGRIAGINQMTSVSQLGSTGITLQFDLGRNIDAAGRDVQAAINAARSQLPTNLPGNPTYRKVNPADAPIMILGLTSDIIKLPQIYDAADSILSQKLAQIEGVGQVFVGGGAQPAVRAELNPTLLNKLGVGLDTVRTALGNANANKPKGSLDGPVNSWTLDANDQIFTADQYRRLIVSYNNGAPVRLGDVGTVTDSVADIRNIGLSGGKPAVLIIVFRQPGANIIATVDRVRAALPLLKSSISPAIDVNVVLDRTITVRASVQDIEFTLLDFGRTGHPCGFCVSSHLPSHAHSQRCRPLVVDRNFRCDVSAELQSGQSFPDGPGHFDRLRGGRCHRGAGKHHSPHRGRSAAGGCRFPGRPRDWLYRALHEHCRWWRYSFRFC